MSEKNVVHVPAGTVVRVDARREFTVDRSSNGYHRLLSGWAAEQVVLSDGRRQVIGLFLPEERIIASSLSRRGEASCLLAITPLGICLDQPMRVEAELELLQAELDRRLSQGFRAVARLGTLTAYEKTANLLLEIAIRAGMTDSGSMDFPLTQELLADLLGLSQVHVNRTLQQLRRDRLIELQGGRLTILQPGPLRKAAQFRSLFLQEDARLDRGLTG